MYLSFYQTSTETFFISGITGVEFTVFHSCEASFDPQLAEMAERGQAQLLAKWVRAAGMIA